MKKRLSCENGFVTINYCITSFGDSSQFKSNFNKHIIELNVQFRVSGTEMGIELHMIVETKHEDEISPVKLAFLDVDLFVYKFSIDLVAMRLQISNKFSELKKMGRSYLKPLWA